MAHAGTGLDFRIDEFGRLQIATNTPTGHVYQVLSLRPSTAYALKAWLGGQDWDAIKSRCEERPNSSQ